MKGIQKRRNDSNFNQKTEMLKPQAGHGTAQSNNSRKKGEREGANGDAFNYPLPGNQ